MNRQVISCDPHQIGCLLYAQKPPIFMRGKSTNKKSEVVLNE